MLSLHTSPLDQPGTGDSGGMNVFVREVSHRLAGQGIPVDVFTRCNGRGGPSIVEVAPGNRLIQVHAGPCATVAKEDLTRFLRPFLGGVLDRQREEGRLYDVVHSHYWLSGWVGDYAKEIWGVPLVASFHTLGKVKNASLSGEPAEPGEPQARLSEERRVVERADRILAPTPSEAAHLVGLYGADRERVRIVPGGVEHSVFFPRGQGEARDRLHLGTGRLVLFVGRLQPHKGPDLAIRTVAEAVRREPATTKDVVLAVVGGQSGGDGVDEVGELMRLAAQAGIDDRVMFFPPQPQTRLADFYSAANVVLVPSRSESFGLVALEAQACGTPVLGAATGGLRYVVRHGRTGYLVMGRDPGPYAERLLDLLDDPVAARRMGQAGEAHARRYTWDATTASVLSVYEELVGTGNRAPAA
jgi:D-inositol-3-phosphate glycosyltransferase